MGLLDGVNRQEAVSDRIPMPVDIVADTAYVNSITGETVQLYYFSNALLTGGTSGSATYTEYVALTSTTKFELDINGKTYVVNPDFTGDVSMANVAASIQTAIRAVTSSTETCTWSTDHFIFTVVKDESGEGMGNSISVLRNTGSNTGVNLAGASWLDGLYGTGVVTPATLTTDAGQAAGTIVMFKLAYSGICDALGAMIGNESASSLAWTTGTVLPAKYIQHLPKWPIESSENKELVDIAYEVARSFTTNGEWGLDFRSGLGIGRKATTGTSDTAAYKIQTQTTGGGGSVTASQDIQSIKSVDLVADNAASPATDYPLPVGGQYNSTSPTYLDGDRSILQTNSSGALKVDATFDGELSIPPYTHSSARGDFTAAYTSNVTITITGADTLTNDQLVFIKLTDTAGTSSSVYVNGQDGVTMSTSANVITITGAGTPFTSGDTYDVGVNLQDKAYDADLDVNKNVVQNPEWARNTSPEAYTVFAPDDATYDEGAVISTAGYNYLNLAYSKSASDADDTNIKVIYLMTADSAVDFQETSISAPAGGVTTIDDNIYTRDKAALVEIVTFPTKGFPFMRIDMAKTADTGTDSTITTYVNKSYL